MIGYRFRFLPERTFFYDLDVTVGFQNMNSRKYSPFLAADGDYVGHAMVKRILVNLSCLFRSGQLEYPVL